MQPRHAVHPTEWMDPGLNVTASVPTMMPFRFAVQGGPWRDPEATVALARLVESLGYDELYSSDHVGGADPYAPLVFAAAATERISFGPLVLNNEFHHPALLARTVATADVLSGGRMILGLGTGYAASEHAAIGLELRPPKQRVDRFGECAAILRDLLADGSCHRSGEHHVVDLDDLGIRPARPVPILIGGFGRRVVAIGGAYADMFQFTGLVHAADGSPTAGGFALAEVERRAAWLTEASEGRPVERSALVQACFVGDDAPSPVALAERFELDEDVVADTPFALTGSVDQIVDKLERLRERTGISHYVVREPEAFAPVVDALAGT